MSKFGKSQVFSTAGAIPIKNEKGQIAMEKVKVQRYVAGKRPEFADDRSSSESESSDDESKDHRDTGGRFARPRLPASIRRGDGGEDREIKKEVDDDESSSSRRDVAPKPDVNDPRLRRLQNRISRDDDEDEDEDSSRRDRHGRRHIEEPQVIKRPQKDRRSISSSSSSEGSDGEDDRRRRRASPDTSRHRRGGASDDEEDELSDDELERRRMLLRLRAKEREREEELLAQQDESDKESGVEDEESEYEEYSESEDESAPRLKPVFVRKRDRLTLQETEREQQRLNQLQLEQTKMKEQTRRETVKLVENIVKQEIEMERKKKDDDDRFDLTAVNTDDENEELAYESWKLRELKRIKRDKEERELRDREKAELDRIHSMTEEERRAYLRLNPKIVTNKAHKGKYKFLQKYFHRGVFFLDKDDDVYQRNFAEPTLEDQFDKSILPKVMQVKDFGKAGRTKWTHLVAEDTTDFQSAWNADSQQNIKFHQKHSAGVKEVFERPSAAKRRKT